MKPWSEMTAQERDALVAEKVMGWRVGEHPELHGKGQMMVEYEEPVYFKDCSSFLCAYEWEPSTDISAAWEVVEKMKIVVSPQSDGAPEDMKYMATKHGFKFDGSNSFTVFAPTAPEAICLVALRAVGVEV